MDFLAVIDPSQGITLAGQFIARPRLGLHLRLGKLSDEIQDALRAADSSRVAALIRKYFWLTGFDSNGLTGIEQLEAYNTLFELNRIKMLFAFQLSPISDPKEKVPYEYEGRNWAWWIHKLASRYGWTSDQILNLWPEEVAAYLQEIIVSEYDELDERRSLSQLAYKYNKITKESKFHPIPRPVWMKEKPESRPIMRRVRRDMLPIGNIIDLRGKTNDDFEFIH